MKSELRNTQEKLKSKLVSMAAMILAIHYKQVLYVRCRIALLKWTNKGQAKDVSMSATYYKSMLKEHLAKCPEGNIFYLPYF